MTPTPQQFRLLADIGSGMSTVTGNGVVHVDALIARGLVTGVRLGYFHLRLTPEGRHVLSQAEGPIEQPSARTYQRRRSDKP
ncbi:hypothetical protein [Pseudomonas japonica]|uniref:hypothetical protein n=1 Tax=Pseudomonas japonica TaxID=256466 RepID=UPI0015E3F5A1|nr:hypothetical protein [Pseudomonas japonica]MBA1245440.1 hypothetical protein [Pseudomonas japonica]